MELKSIYLHAGSPKTGTSSLQSFLAINLNNLLKQGIDYPTLMPLDDAIAGEVSSGNGEHLARSMLSEGNPERIDGYYADIAWEKLTKSLELSNSKAVVISSEYFFVATNDGLMRLKQLANDFGVCCKPLIWIRPQWDLFYSAYAQLIKTNKTTLTLQQYLREFVQRKELVKYFETLNRYCDIFGDDNVCVKRYQKDKMVNHDICDDFMSAIGFSDLVGFSRPEKAINPTPTFSELEILLGVGRSSRSPEFGAFYSDALRAVREVTPFKPNYLNRDIALELYNEFKDENDLIREKYFPEDSDLFDFSDDSNDSLAIDVNSVQSNIIVLAAMIAKLDQRLRKIEGLLLK